MVDHCEYGELQNEMIRDHIVVGLTDMSLAEKFPELTLEAAITKARQSEMVKKQQAVVRVDLPYVDDIHKRKLSKDKIPTENKQEHCTRCGKTPSHARQNCPTKDSVYHRCKKKRHFQSQCKFKKSINSITTDIPEESENAFLGTIYSTNSYTTEWLVELYLNKVHATFKIDTGVEVTAIPEAIYSSTIQSHNEGAKLNTVGTGYKLTECL